MRHVATKANRSFERATNLLERFERDRRRMADCFGRLAPATLEEFMNANQIEAKFAGMGARFKLSAARGEASYAIDIQRDRMGEFFEFRLSDRARWAVDLTVLQAD